MGLALLQSRTDLGQGEDFRRVLLFNSHFAPFCVKTQAPEFPWLWDKCESESSCGLRHDRSLQHRVCGKRLAPSCLPTTWEENEK